MISYFQKMDCKVCDKRFTGMEPYQQHMNSEKHKKKMMIHHQNNGTPNTTFSASSQASYGALARNKETFSCETCSKIFYSLPDYMQHSVSEEHANMVLNKKSETSMDLKETPLCSSSTDEFSANSCGMNNLDSVTGLNVNTGLLNQSVSYYSKCQPCNKVFSGLESYQQHIVSNKHLKKCGSLPPFESQIEGPKVTTSGMLSSDVCDKMLDNSSSFQHREENIDHMRKTLAESNSIKRNPNEMTNLICYVCDMTFSGPIPHSQHLQSQSHEKGVRRKELLIQMKVGKENRKTDVVDSVTKPTGKAISSPWYCETCDKICSGPEPYRAHMVSEKHRKNVAKAEADGKQSQIRNIMAQPTGEVDIFSTQKSAGGDLSMLDDNNAGCVSKKPDKEFKDSSLSEPSTSFCAIDVAHLNLTLFKVGEEINFDKNEKSDINMSELEDVDMDDEDNEETKYEDMPSP